MAKKLSGKTADKEIKEKIQLTLAPDVALKLRLAALGNHMDLSEFVTGWILREYSGVHIRGLEKGNSDAPELGKGSGPTVKISTMNRISDIARKSNLPVDEALEGFDQD